jgi:Flp pilus assembly pilin Flp
MQIQSTSAPRALANLLYKFVSEENGQGITEYGALIAFVAIMVAFAFSANGALQSGVVNAYSTVSHQLNNLSSAGGNAQG